MKAFLDELKKGFPAAAYLAYSNDDYLLYEARLTVKGLLPRESMDFAYEGFDAGEGGFSAAAVIDAHRAIPFMGGRKFVILENLQEAKAAEVKKLAAYLDGVNTPADNKNLLFMFELAKKPSAFEGVKPLPLSLGPRDLPDWIRSRARREGFELSPDAVSLIAENYGSEPGLAASEIKKFSLLGIQKVGIADMKKLMEDMSGYGAFEIIGAMKTGDRGLVLKMARSLKGTQDMILLMGALNREYAGRKLAPEAKRKAMEILREADIRVRATPAYPVEEVLLRLMRQAN
ncbi:MAG: hypothetical protein M0Z52_06730 [Actinomycetota bacterium]|nr:hypothetical protein [Actinomycetota bacterium]